MNNFRKIFVAIDFSPIADEALRQAHLRAEAANAHLAVCHIVPNELRSDLLFPQITKVAALQIPLELAQISEAAAQRVTEITGRTEKQYELIVDDGAPHAVILSHAEEWAADLVVMGSHGESGPGEALLGSVTNSVLRHAHCPVLIVRPGERSQSIVAGTDFSDPSMPAVRAAADEAERTGAKLTVVHSLDLIWSPASYPALAFGGTPFNISADQITELEGIARERLEKFLRESEITGDALITTGPAGMALVNVAKEEISNLIVVGTTGRSGLRRALLGSVAEFVTSNSPCSVLVVRRHPE
jgi:nucleotide-binding universal stress UspA family protein